jgi:hypothetical protein
MFTGSLHILFFNYELPVAISYRKLTRCWTERIVTFIAEERTRITRNTCHVTTTQRCVTSPRTRRTQPRELLHVGSCLQSSCLATRWSNHVGSCLQSSCLATRWSYHVGSCLQSSCLTTRSSNSLTIPELSTLWGHELVSTLCYKLEGRRFESRWGNWMFQLV